MRGLSKVLRTKPFDSFFIKTCSTQYILAPERNPRAPACSPPGDGTLLMKPADAMSISILSQLVFFIIIYMISKCFRPYSVLLS